MSRSFPLSLMWQSWSQSLVLSSALAILGGLAAQGATPHWITATNDDRQSPRLSKTFSIQEPIQGADLKIAADFCTATVTLNGQPVISVEPYCPLQVVDVTRHLQRGSNELAVSTAPVPGPAAVAVSFWLAPGFEV